MDQGGGLKRLTGFFLCQELGRELAQLLIYQGQQLFRGVRITGLHGRQEAGYFGH